MSRCSSARAPRPHASGCTAGLAGPAQSIRQPIGGETMNSPGTDLDSLGDALERAAERDVIRSRAQRRRRSRRFAVAAVAVAVAIPGLAFAADRLIGGAEVARSLPAGVLALAGRIPRAPSSSRTSSTTAFSSGRRLRRSRTGRAPSSRRSMRQSTSTGAAGRYAATVSPGSATSAARRSTSRSSARDSSASTHPPLESVERKAARAGRGSRARGEATRPARTAWRESPRRRRRFRCSRRSEARGCPRASCAAAAEARGPRHAASPSR